MAEQPIGSVGRVDAGIEHRPVVVAPGERVVGVLDDFGQIATVAQVFETECVALAAIGVHRVGQSIVVGTD